VQIAAEHAEAVRQRSWMRVEERFLLDRITLHTGDVSPRHAQASAFVEPYLADAQCALRNRAAVSACIAAEPRLARRASVDGFHQLRRGVTGTGGESIVKRRQLFHATRGCKESA
jgi:hypothetical protein